MHATFIYLQISLAMFAWLKSHGESTVRWLLWDKNSTEWLIDLADKLKWIFNDLYDDTNYVLLY